MKRTIVKETEDELPYLKRENVLSYRRLGKGFRNKAFHSVQFKVSSTEEDLSFFSDLCADETICPSIKQIVYSTSRAEEFCVEQAKFHEPLDEDKACEMFSGALQKYQNYHSHIRLTIANKIPCEDIPDWFLKSSAEHMNDWLRTIRIVVHALARSNCKASTLAFHLETSNILVDEEPDAVDEVLNPSIRDEIKRVCHDTREMSFRIDIRFDNVLMEKLHDTISAFISCAPNLNTLHLENIGGHKPDPHVELEDLKRLGQLGRLLPKVASKVLVRFALDGLLVDARVLIDFLQSQSRSLQDLVLYAIYLDSNIQTWVKILQWIQSSGIPLKYFHLGPLYIFNKRDENFQEILNTDVALDDEEIESFVRGVIFTIC